MRKTILFVLLLGCAGNSNQVEPQAPQPDAARTVAPDGEATPVFEGTVKPDEAPAAQTPQALYEQCFDRVENPQVEGECESDADCATAGCGGEICTTAAAAAAGIMSTCEVRPCFAVLDTCGCNDGVCTWSLKDEVPAPRPIAIPPPADG